MRTKQRPRYSCLAIKLCEIAILLMAMLNILVPATAQTQNTQTIAPKIISIIRASPVTQNATNAKQIIWHIEFSKPVLLTPNNFEIIDNENNPLPDQQINIGNKRNGNIYPVIASNYKGYDGIAKLLIKNNITDLLGNELSNTFNAPSFNLINNPTITNFQRLDGDENGNFTATLANQLRLRWRIRFSENLSNNFNLNNAFAISGGNDRATLTIARDSTTPEPNNYILTYDNYGRQFTDTIMLNLTHTPQIRDENNYNLINGFPDNSKRQYHIFQPLIATIQRHHPQSFFVDSQYLEWKITFPRPIENFDARDLQMIIVDDPAPSLSRTIPQNAIIDEPRQINDTEYIVRWRNYGNDFHANIALQFSPTNDIADNNNQPLATLPDPLSAIYSILIFPEISNITPLDFLQHYPTNMPATTPTYTARWQIEFNRLVRGFDTSYISFNFNSDGNFGIPTQAQQNINVAPQNTQTINGEAYANIWIVSVNVNAGFHGNITLNINRHQTNIITPNDTTLNSNTPLNHSQTIVIAPTIIAYRRNSDERNRTAAAAMSWQVEFTKNIKNITANDFELVSTIGTRQTIINAPLQISAAQNTRHIFNIGLENYQSHAANLADNEIAHFSIRIKTNNTITDINNTQLDLNIPPTTIQEPYRIHPIFIIKQIRFHSITQDRDNFNLQWQIKFSNNIDPTQVINAFAARNINNHNQTFPVDLITQINQPFTWRIKINVPLGHSVATNGAVQLFIENINKIKHANNDNIIMPNNAIKPANPTQNYQTQYAWGQVPALNRSYIFHLVERQSEFGNVGDNQNLVWIFEFTQNVNLTANDFIINFNNTPHPDIENRIRNNITASRYTADPIFRPYDWVVQIDAQYIKGFNGNIEVVINPNNNITSSQSGIKLANPQPINNVMFQSFNVNTSPIILTLKTITPENSTTTIIGQGNENITTIQNLDPHQNQTIQWQITFSEAVSNVIPRNFILQSQQQTIAFEINTITLLPNNNANNPTQTYIISANKKQNTTIADAYIALQAKANGNSIADRTAKLLLSPTVEFENKNEYLIFTRPALLSLQRQTPATVQNINFALDDSSQMPISWIATFSKRIENIDRNDFIITTQSNNTINSIITRVAHINGNGPIDPTTNDGFFQYQIYATIRQAFANTETLQLIFSNTQDIQSFEKNDFIYSTNAARAIAPQTTLATSLPQGNNYQTFTIDTSPELLAITRLSPTRQLANNYQRVAWQFIFSEPVFNVNRNNFIQWTNNNFCRTNDLNCTHTMTGDLQVQHNDGDNIAIVSINNLGGFDGLVRAQFTLANDITDENGQTVNSPIENTRTNPRISNDRFTIQNQPSATITKLSTLQQGVLVANNPTPTWQITFDENVIFNKTAYSIINAPFSVQLDITEISPRQHNISARNFGEFNGTIKLSINHNSIIETHQQAKHMLAIENQNNMLEYEIKSTINVVSIIRQPQINNANEANKISGDITALSNNLRPAWNIKFDRPLANLTNEDIVIVGSNILPDEFYFDMIKTSTTIKIMPQNLYGYDGEMKIKILDIGERATGSTNNLPLNQNTQPLTTNQNRFTLSLQPNIFSITQINSNNNNSIKWKIKFTEPINGIDANDFFATPNPALHQQHNPTGELTITINPDNTEPANTSWIITAIGTRYYAGNITLNINTDHNITDQSTDNNPLTNTTPIQTNESTITIANIAPNIQSITRHPSNQQRQQTNELEWKISFSEPIQNITADDFIINFQTEQTITHQTIHLIQNPNNNLQWFYKLQIINGFMGEAEVSINIKQNRQHITDFNTPNAALANTRPTAESYIVDPPIEIISITRHAPTTELAQNQTKLIWHIKFSEQPFSTNINNALQINEFEILLNETKLNATLQLGTPLANFIYPITFTQFDTIDGNIKLNIKNNHTIIDNTSQTLSTTTARINENIFQVINNPKVTITRQATIDGTTQNYSITENEIDINIHNLQLQWVINFNEPVIFNADAYTINIDDNIFSQATISQISDQQHLIVLTNLQILQGKASINIDPTLILDNNNHQLLTNHISGKTIFNIDLQPPTITLQRITPFTQGTPLNINQVQWRIVFSETVQTFPATIFSLQPNSLTANITIAADPDNEMAWIITANNFSPFTGTIFLNLQNNSNIKLANGTPFTITLTQSQLLNASFAIDNQPPIINAIRRKTPTTQNATDHSTIPHSKIQWEVIYNENVTIENNQNPYSLASNPAINSDVEFTFTQTTEKIHTITISNYGTYNGTLTLNIANQNFIFDKANPPNILSNTTPAINENSFLFNHLPEIEAFTRRTPVKENTNDDASNSGTLEWMLQFSKDVVGFTKQDIEINLTPANDTVLNDIIITLVPINAKTYIIRVSHFFIYDGRISINLKTDHAIQDTNTPPNNFTQSLPQNINSFLVDTEQPQVNSIDTITTEIGNDRETLTLQWQIIFSEPIRNFDIDDVEIAEDQQITGPILLTTQTINQQTYIITAQRFNEYQGTITLQINQTNNIEDLEGNDLALTTARSTNNFFIDTKPPIINQLNRHKPQQQNAANASTLQWQIVFDENVNLAASNFDIVEIENETINIQPNTTSQTYIITISEYGEYDGLLTLALDPLAPANITDQDNNELVGGLPDGNNNFAVDRIAPRIVNFEKINSQNNNFINATQVQWNIQFSEAVIVPANAFIASNATIDNIQQNDNSFIITATPHRQIEAQVALQLKPDHNITDLANNRLLQTINNAQEIFHIDNNAPIINAIMFENPQSEQVYKQETIAWRIVFSEAIKGFDESDIEIITKPNFQHHMRLYQDHNDNKNWLVEINGYSQSYNGSITLNIKQTEHNISDLAGVAMAENFAPPPILQNRFFINSPIETNQLITISQNAIAEYIQTRAKQMINFNPQNNKQRLFNFNINNNGYNVVFQNKIEPKKTNENIWVNVKAARDKSNSAITQSAFLTIGYEYKFTPTTSYGFITQFDETEFQQKQLNENFNITGKGWLLAPFSNIKLSTNFTLNTLFAFGQTKNKIQRNNSLADTFKTKRFMINADITGEKKLGQWQTSPYLGLKMYDEKQDGFISQFISQNILIIPEQNYSLQRATLGHKFAKIHKYKNLQFKSIFDFVGTYDFENIKNNNRNKEFNLQIKPSLALQTKDGTNIYFSGFYDLIYENTYSYGINIYLGINF